MRVRFEFDSEACSCCCACSIACMDQNDIDVEAGQAPFRKVFRLEEGHHNIYMSVACMHCENAPCIPACPKNCLWKDPESGLTLLDNTACIGCRACARACPYDAPTFRPTGLKRPKVKMEKCCGCMPRIEAGLRPSCVGACPTGALTVRVEERPCPAGTTSGPEKEAAE